MNLDSLSFALAQISYSVANLTKKNYKSCITEISHLITQHGPEADRHLYRCLFSHVDFSGDGKSSGKDFHQTQFLIQECPQLIAKPNFVSVLCYVIDNPLHHQKSLKPSSQLFGQLSKVLKLNRIQEVAFGLALLHSSNSEIRQHAAQFVKLKLPQLINAYTDPEASSQEAGLQDLPIEVLHLIISHLLSSPDSLGLTTEQKDTFLRVLCRDCPTDQVPIVLAPFLFASTEDVALTKLYPETPNLPKVNMETNLAETVSELGYQFTSSVEECRSCLMKLGVREITSASVGRVIGVMCRKPTGIIDPVAIQVLTLGNNASAWTNDTVKPDSSPQSWNVDIFVQVVKDLAPHVNWKEVVRELDHPGLVVANKASLRLIVQALHRGIQEEFPIEHIYRLWNNTEAQLSWIVQSLANPDVFCFANYPTRQVVTEVLKTLPDEENRDIATWKSLDLLELLLKLSEVGHYHQVLELFKFPVQQCPDLLVLGLIQLPMWNTMKHELLTNLVPIFLGSHPNSSQVLNYAWHSTSQPALIRTSVMQGMAQWYVRSDPADLTLRLSRILDVAQELKALTVLLNATAFSFVIDLACLASRRQFLKLDKWIGDKLRENGEPFAQACVVFLRRRMPQLQGISVKDDMQAPMRSQMLPLDTANTILTCLSICIGNVSPDLSDAIQVMVTNGNVLMAKLRQQGGPMGGVTGSIGPPGSLPPGMPGSVDSIGGLSVGSGAFMAPSLAGPGGLGSVGGGSGMGGPGAIGTAGTNQFASSLAGMAPGRGSAASPVKSLFSGPIGQSSGGPTFNPVQSLASQLQGLNLAGMPGNISTTLSSLLPPRGAPSLSSMSMQAAAKQMPPGVGVPGAAGAAPTSQLSAMDRIRPGGVAESPPQQRQVTPIQFTKEVEDEANSYFQRIYNPPPNAVMSIDEALQMLKRFKDSPIKREKEVFQCMLKNLFEEYRFFTQYPDKELHTTALLFGGIIDQGLVTYMELGYALRYVLEALKKPHGTKMFTFGITALDSFKARLRDYPQYCLHLGSIPHFSQFPPALKEYVEFGTRLQEPPTRPVAMPTRSITPVKALMTTPVPPNSSVASMVPVAPPQPRSSSAGPGNQPPATAPAAPAPAAPTVPASTAVSTTTTRPSLATATNIDTLLAGTEGKENIAVPDERFQDRIFFIFNNLSISNMDQKATELKDIITDEYLPWVAQYLVMKRASIEHNFHTLYSSFIDQLAKNDFTLMVVKETYRNIKVLLRSDKGIANFSDRTLLKNLGHWLGMLTLAKDKPILHLDMDVKSLLYEAYHKGTQELLYVVPFVAKVLESCAKSRIFRPNNPWTMGIMSVLAELHHEPELKLNLKFEIEVLCKSLQLEAHDLIPSNYLKDLSRHAEIEPQLSQPKPKELPAPSQPVIPPVPTALMMTGPPPGPPLLPGTKPHAPGILPSPAQLMMVPPPPALPSMAGASGMRTPPIAPLQAPAVPQFSYADINVTSMSGLAPHIAVNEQLELFTAHPQLKSFVRPAIERSVQELLAPVVERTLKITLTCCEQIVRKDFALDPDENHMRVAATHFVRYVTAGMALTTCREPLLNSITSNLKTAFLQSLRAATQQQKEMIEQAAQVIAQENVELMCAFIQKTASERAVPELEKKLASDYELRKHARSEMRRYCDPAVLTYQAERMPEQIRLKVGGVTGQQMAVYEDFSRVLPGFLPTSIEKPPTQQIPAAAGIPVAAPFASKPFPPAPTFGTDDLAQIYEKMVQELERQVHQVLMPAGQAASSHIAGLTALIESIIVARSSHGDISATLAVVQKAVDGLLEGLARMTEHDVMMCYRDCHLFVLKGLQNPRALGAQVTNKQVTRCLIETQADLRYIVDAVDCIIRSRLVAMQQYDVHLSNMLDPTLPSGVNYVAVMFAMQLVQRFCLDDKLSAQVLFQADFYNTIEQLTKVAMVSRPPPDGLLTLLENLQQQHDMAFIDRSVINPQTTAMMQMGISQAREFDDPAGLQEKADMLLHEWIAMYHSPQAGRDSSKAFQTFVQLMQSHGILKSDDLITRFFRLSMEICVGQCHRALQESVVSPTLARNKCFHMLDAFVRLVALMVKHSGDATNAFVKINLLNKVLGIIAGVLLTDHEVRGVEFHQLPYHRILIMLFIELNVPEVLLESLNFHILAAFAQMLHVVRPSRAPAFAFAWLEIISHRVFVGRMLAVLPHQKGWSMYAQLLSDLLKFMAPFLRNVEQKKSVHQLYKGTLRVLLVLLHDFPEFLCDYYYAFCDIIPPNCIQMRNLILSAYPRNMRLPDPFVQNLKVETLPEITHMPRIVPNFANNIRPAEFKRDLDSYLKTRAPVTFPSELRSHLQTNEPGQRYDIQLMNALVLYVGLQAIQHIHSKGQMPNMTTIAHSSHMDIFLSLVVDLDTDGRYLFLNALANHLRSPNSYTHYFSCTILFLFAEANTEVIQEQITKVLLERLIVNRPHPWGLLVTFIELLKNPVYKFWSHDFVHCATEIEKLFDTVARSCVPQKMGMGRIGEMEAPQQQQQQQQQQQPQ